MNLTYKDFINNIITTRGRHGCGDIYHEKHHIIPKCLGGENKEENYIDLFAREHYEAHKLLALENPDNDKLIRAWFLMSHVKNKYEERVNVSAEEYEQAKKAYSKMRSKQMSGKNNSFYGKHHTKETREKIKERTSGKNNPMYGVKRPDDYKKKMSELRKGDKNPRWGVHLSLETKRKLGKPVYCIEKQKFYYSVKEAQEDTHILSQNICYCCKNKNRTAGGYHWRYATEEEVKANGIK